MKLLKELLKNCVCVCVFYSHTVWWWYFVPVGILVFSCLFLLTVEIDSEFFIHFCEQRNVVCKWLFFYLSENIWLCEQFHKNLHMQCWNDTSHGYEISFSNLVWRDGALVCGAAFADLKTAYLTRKPLLGNFSVVDSFRQLVMLAYRAREIWNPICFWSLRKMRPALVEAVEWDLITV